MPSGQTGGSREYNINEKFSAHSELDLDVMVEKSVMREMLEDEWITKLDKMV